MIVIAIIIYGWHGAHVVTCLGGLVYDHGTGFGGFTLTKNS